MARSQRPKLEIILGAVDRISAPLRAVNRKIDSIQRPIREVRNALRGLAKESGLYTLARKFQGVGTGLGKLRQGFLQVVGHLALIGGAVGFAAYSMMERLAGTAGEIVDMSKQLGITTEELQGLRFAAQMTGGSAGAFDKAFMTMNKNLSAAAMGGGAAKGAFRELGVSVRDQSGRIRKNSDVFRDVADKLSMVGDQSHRTRLAMAIFGKSGGSLLNMLGEGTEGIDAWTARAQRLGLITSGPTIKGLDKLSDKFDEMRAIVSANALAIAGELVPGVNKIIDATIGWWEANRATVLPMVVAHLRTLVDWTGKFLGWVVQVAPRVLGFIDAIGGLKAVLGVLAAVALFPVITGLGMMVAGIGTIVAAVGTLPLVFGAVAAAVVALWGPATVAFEYYADLWKKFVGFIEGKALAAVNAISGVLSPIAGAFDALGGALGIRPAEPAFATPGPAAPIGARGGAGSLPGRAAAAGAGGAARVDGTVKVEVSDERVRARIVHHAGAVGMEVDSGVAHVPQS